MEFKEIKRKNLENISEQNEESLELGRNKIENWEKSLEILNSIELVDVKDVSEIKETGEKIHDAYGEAFEKDVEEPLENNEAETDNIIAEIESERDNVQDGIRKIRSLEGISDTGKESAEGAERNLERSDSEYEQIEYESQSITREQMKEAMELREKLKGSFFGSNF